MNERLKRLHVIWVAFEQERQEEDWQTPPKVGDTALGRFTRRLIDFAVIFGSMEAVLWNEDDRRELVFMLPDGTEWIAPSWQWFRMMLPRFCSLAEGLRPQLKEEPEFTEEEIARQYARLRLLPRMPGDTEYDRKARRNRVLRSLRESPVVQERVAQRQASHLNLYGFAVTVDYPQEGGTIPLYIETMNDNHFPYRLLLRRLAEGESRPEDRPNLVGERLAELRKAREAATE